MDDANVALYDLLGVSIYATDSEIEESYNNLAKEFHPEDAVDKLKEITFAYEVLSDPEKRTLYDGYGVKGLQDGDSDIFVSSCFSPTNDDIHTPLFVSMDQLYNGVETISVTYKRSELCVDCNAEGGDSSKLECCTHCVSFVLRSPFGYLGPDFCIVCNGRGSIIMEEFQCKTCEGKGCVDNENTVNVKIKPGMQHNEQIPVRFEGHQNREGNRGYLVAILQERSHSVFQRKSIDLYLEEVEIPLIQALCGLEYTFKHMDGRNIVVRTQPGQVIKPKAVRVIKGEGMPKRNNPLEKGDLFISFVVRMPENDFVSAEVRNRLEEILPSRMPFTMPTGEDVEEVELVDIQPKEKRMASGEDPGVEQCVFSKIITGICGGCQWQE